MIGTAIITLALFFLIYSVLTRKSTPHLNRQRLIILDYNVKNLGLKPLSKDSRAVMKNGNLHLKGSWGNKKRGAKVMKKVALCLALTILIYYFTEDLLSLGALGAAFTSKASGDWDAAGQTTWNEVGSPGAGDTVVINNTHVVRVDSGTGNEKCYTIDVLDGGEFIVDSEGAGALSFTFDDTAGSGYLSATAGQITYTGTAGNLVTVTGDGAPPANYFNHLISKRANGVTMDYTTIQYHTQFGTISTGGLVPWNINNCVFQNNNGLVNVYLRGGVVVSFTNNTITGGTYGLTIVPSAIVTNITISGTGTYDLYVGYATSKVELINCNFDITKVRLLGSYISKDHGGVSGTYHIATNSTLAKSAITNDFTSSDNVTMYGTGTFTVDEAAAHNNLTIMVNSTFDVNGGVTQTITHTGTITVDVGGTLEWTGSAGNLITLVSSSPGTEWSLVNNGTVNVSYVDVTDSDASGGTAIDATDGTSIGKSQNNTNWLWPPAGGGGGPNSSSLILPLELSG